MKSSTRLCSRLALVAGLGFAQLIACSSDSPNEHGEVRRTGTLGLALRAVSDAGNTYILRSAFFQITDARTGRGVDFLSTDNVPDTVTTLSTILSTGNYTVQLLDGWFLERVGGNSSGSGGSPSSSGGSSPSSAGGASTGAVGGKAPPPDEDPGAGNQAGEPPVEPGTGGTGNMGGGTGTAGSGVGGTGTAGSGVGGSSGGSEVVEAHLVSDAIQFFALFGGDDAFVRYQFQVGKEVVDFQHGRLNIDIGVNEDPGDPGTCETPAGSVRASRVLLETNLLALPLTLEDALTAIATNGGRSDVPLDIYHQIIDSYATAQRGRDPDAIHCGDETDENGNPTLNGFPIECDRREAQQFDNMGAFFQTAFVNRMDLAPLNGAHCGQQRMIFANNAQNRMFMILEAQIPNPSPELGLKGCQPLAQFWLDANAIDDPGTRGKRLTAAFLTGSPELVAAGFGPFATATNYTVGSGQIRTNQFDQDPWTLREFKLAVEDDTLRAIPFPVAESPAGALWNEDSGLPQGEACRANFLQAVDGLLTNDPSEMSFIVDGPCKDGESRNDGSETYINQLSRNFASQLEERLVGTRLTPEDIANRAEFAGSCIGCHEAATRRSLGLGVVSPSSTGFVHVSEFASSCREGVCFQPSSALTDVFLPSRLAALGTLLGQPLVGDPCESTNTGGGTPPPAGGASGTGGSTTSGSAGRGSLPDTGDVAVEAPVSEPAPVIEIELASAETPVGELEQADAEIREAYGEKTVSGRSAKSTH